MSKFQYPMLPRHESIGVLSEYQIADVSEAELLNPNMNLVMNIYSAILLHITVLQEDQEQFQDHVDFQALEHLENPDQHVESVRILNLFDKIYTVLNAIDCPMQFTVKDLIAPNANRTEIFLGSLLNFFLHRGTKLDLLGPVVEEMTRDDEQRQQLEAQIAQLSGEIAELNAQRDQEMPFVQLVDARVKELRQSIQILNNQQMSLKLSIRKSKDKVKEVEEKIGNAEFVLVQSVQENGSLHSKIVQSPDKLQRALEEKRLLKSEAEKAAKAARQSFHDKNAILEMYTKACKKMSKQSDRLKAIQEQVNSSKTIEKDLKLLKAKLAEEEVVDKSLDAKLVEKKTKLYHLEELKRQLQHERDVSCLEANKEFNNVKLELETKKSGLVVRQKQVEAVVSEADAINAQINVVKESGAATMQKLYRKSEAIMKEFYQYSNSFRDLLPEVELNLRVLTNSET